VSFQVLLLPSHATLSPGRPHALAAAPPCRQPQRARRSSGAARCLKSPRGSGGSGPPLRSVRGTSRWGVGVWGGQAGRAVPPSSLLDTPPAACLLRWAHHASRGLGLPSLSCEGLPRRPRCAFIGSFTLFFRPLPQRSSQLYSRASQADPRDDRTWLQWGLLERRRARPAAALRCFAEGTKAAPRNPYMWQARALRGAAGAPGCRREPGLRGSALACRSLSSLAGPA
jgi:hypothetical protein